MLFYLSAGNFTLGAYSTATQIYGLWDKYVIKGEPWGDESLGEVFGAVFGGVTTAFSGKGVVDDIVNYKNIKHDILTSQCFVEGTLVVTADGDKPIEEIQAGDFVYSTDPETGESEYKEVVRTFRKKSDVLIHIFVNGEEIQTTPVHPFWVEDEWVSAKDLEAGDKLTLADGTTATITKIYGEQLDEPVIVYNFEVSDFHTYYVTDTGVLVHNLEKEGCGRVQSLQEKANQKRDELIRTTKGGSSKSMVVTAYNIKTGDTEAMFAGPISEPIHKSLIERAKKIGGIGSKGVSGRNTVGVCAEFKVVNSLMLKGDNIDIKDIRLGKAIRPRTGKIQPYCPNCLAMFSDLLDDS